MTHAVKPAKVTNGGNHHRSVRSVRAVICARPADASVVDDTSGKPRLLRNRRAVAEAAAPGRLESGGAYDERPTDVVRGGDDAWPIVTGFTPAARLRPWSTSDRRLDHRAIPAHPRRQRLDGRAADDHARRPPARAPGTLGDRG